MLFVVRILFYSKRKIVEVRRGAFLDFTSSELQILKYFAIHIFISLTSNRFPNQTRRPLKVIFTLFRRILGPCSRFFTSVQMFLRFCNMKIEFLTDWRPHLPLKWRYPLWTLSNPHFNTEIQILRPKKLSGFWFKFNILIKRSNRCIKNTKSPRLTLSFTFLHKIFFIRHLLNRERLMTHFTSNSQ